MKFAIIKERKNPPDRRVVFSPEKFAETKAKLTKVKFDFTDDTTKAASKAMAEEKGIAALYPTGESHQQAF